MRKTAILDYLQNQLPRETIYFHPNPGNAGDSLIAYASFQLFRRLSVDIEIISSYERFDPRGRIVICAGGGNITRYYDSEKKAILYYQERAKKVIILPQQHSRNEELLNRLKNNVAVFCREEVSYNHVQKYARKADVMAADDMAFSLDVDDVMATQRMLKIKAIWQSAVKNVIKPSKNGRIHIRPFLQCSTLFSR